MGTSDDIGAEPAGPPARRAAELLRQRRQRRYDETFAGRSFEIVKEIHLPIGQVCVSVFGHHLRHAYVIRDTTTGERFVVSTRDLRVIHDAYQGIDELPDTRPRLTG